MNKHLRRVNCLQGIVQQINEKRDKHNQISLTLQNRKNELSRISKK